MTKIKLRIITPLNTVSDLDNVEAVTVPTNNGQITLLPGHVPLITNTQTGEITVKKDNKDISYVVEDGYLKCDKSSNITIYSGYAVRGEDIQLEKAQEAIKKAEESMKQKLSREDFLIAETKLRRSLLELKVGRKRRHNIS